MRWVLLGAWLWAQVAEAGTIAGTVRAQGKDGTTPGAGGGKYDSRKFKFADRVDYGQLRDFVVYIDQALAEKPVAPTTPVQVVVQKDAQFSPRVLPVVVGTTVEWPNVDEIYHNAFSMSETKPFDLGLYKENTKSITFDKAGRVDVFCSIHSSMHCVVLVLENSYFAVTDARGQFTIPNVPAGTYRVKVWHDRLPAQTREITVPATGGVKADFTLGITGLPQY